MGEKAKKAMIPLLAPLFEVLNLCTKHKEKKKKQQHQRHSWGALWIIVVSEVL